MGVSSNDKSYNNQTDTVRSPILETASGALEAPKNVISSVTAARTLYYKFRQEHLKRIELCAAIEGLIAGNPPYNPVELAQDNLSHIANFNTLDARAVFEREALSYWNLLNEAETIATFEITDHDPAALKYADIMAYHFDAVVRSWPSFYTLVNSLTSQLVKIGLSPAFWPDERDWRWRTVEYARFLVQDQAQSDIQYLTAVCIESLFTAQYLFEVYTKYKDNKKASPWDIEELEYLLLQRANQNSKNEYQFIDLMDLQRRLQNGDLSWDVIYSDSIRLVSLFYQEYDGKITHYMFDKWLDHGSFLYMVDRQYATMEEALVIFTASPGEFTLHSNRGLGHKIFSAAQAMMQLDCSIIDMARLASTPFIKSLATGTKDAEAIRVWPGVPTNIGNTEFVQTNFGANINQLIEASQYMLSKINANAANSGDDPSIPDKSEGSISPTQERFRTYREFGLLKNNIAHFYSKFDIVIRNMVVKMLRSKDNYPGYEFVREWKRRCKNDGVPDTLFELRNPDQFGMPEFLKVRATRVAGDGSALGKSIALDSLMPIASSFGPKEAKEFKREFVRTHMGKDYVEAFTADDNDADEVSGGASLAQVENAVMQLGQAPLFSPDNESQAHITVHLALGNHTIQGIQQQQMSAIDADKVFTNLIPHLSQHIAFLEKSPFAQGFIAKVKKPWDELRNYATLNRKNAAQELQAQIRKQKEDQAATQETLSDEQRKDVKLKGDEQRANVKVQSQVARAKDANETRANVMRDKVQKDADNNRLKIELEHSNKTLDTTVNAQEANTRQELSKLNGDTIAPYDIEGVTPT